MSSDTDIASVIHELTTSGRIPALLRSSVWPDQPNGRVAAVLDLLLHFARGEFGRRIPVGKAGDDLDKIALALNMVGEELSATTAAKDAVTQLNDQLKEVNRRLEAVVHVDPLTGQLNRRGLEAVLTQEIRRATRQDSSLVAILLDCDDFKKINDQLGHAVGDVVLSELARRVRGALRTEDHLCRIGGDEFLALLPNTRIQEGLEVAERLRLAVAGSPLYLGSQQILVTASMGLSVIPTTICSIEEVLSLTRTGLQLSKGAGKNRVSSGGPFDALASSFDSADEALSQLRDTGNFAVVRQPIVNLDTEEVEAHELLTRSSAPNFSMPMDFFRLAADRNVLTLVDLNCLRACLRDVAEVCAEGPFHLNLFPSTLLASRIEDLLSIFPEDMAPGSFCVELSEQLFIGDPLPLLPSIRALQEAGVRVALDDVGFGRTSLETLLVLEPDVVKIDRSYVHMVASDPGKQRRLQRLVSAMSALRVDLVAEGVERREDLNYLRKLGLKKAQGFLWGRPA